MFLISCIPRPRLTACMAKLMNNKVKFSQISRVERLSCIKQLGTSVEKRKLSLLRIEVGRSLKLIATYCILIIISPILTPFLADLQPAPSLYIDRWLLPRLDRKTWEISSPFCVKYRCFVQYFNRYYKGNK